MGILVLLIGIAVIAFGFFVFVKGGFITQEIRKYEFENRTDGGVVKFKDYDASVAHNRKKTRADLVLKLGGFIAVVGALVTATGLYMLT